MPTTVTFQIGTGETYTSLGAWESAQQSDITAAGADEIHVAQIKNESVTTGTVTGWTTDATHYIVLESASGAYHDGIPGGGAILAGYTLVRQDCKLRNLEFKSSGTTSTAVLRLGNNVGSDTFDFEVTKCIVYSINTAGSNNDGIKVITTSSATVAVEQTLILGAYNYGFSTGSATTTVKNSLCIDCNRKNGGSRGGFNRAASTNYTNCVAWNNGIIDFDNSGGTLLNCASGDTSADGTGAVTGIVAGDFNDDTTDDYHLSGASSALHDAGTDLSGDFTTDIDGDTWADWSIGFDQIAVAAGARPQGPFNHVFNGPFGGPIA